MRTEAERYIQAGWQIIPIPHGAKAPKIKEWQKRIFSADDIHDNENIGIKLGACSGNLIDIDCDWPEARVLLPHYLPPTTGVFGRLSNPDSHHLYICRGAKT